MREERPIVNDNTELRLALSRWLKDSAILAETRRFLKSSGASGGRSGLGDAQLANWRRRGHLPDSFVEGAALYHCAQAKGGQVDPAQRIGIEADAFWQIFIVHETSEPGQTKLDCTILRYWKGVRSTRGTNWLTHVSYCSTGGRNRKDKADVRSLIDEDDNLRVEDEEDGAVVTSWKVGPRPRDYGYRAHFPRTIANNQIEAVGGCPTIPMDAAHMVAFLPRRILDRQKRMTRGTPSACATLLNGNPVRIMERYLGLGETPARGNEDFERRLRRLGPWFEFGPMVEPWHGPVGLPKAVQDDKAFQEAGKDAQAGSCEAFATHTENPLPFLTYFIVFGAAPE